MRKKYISSNSICTTFAIMLLSICSMNIANVAIVSAKDISLLDGMTLTTELVGEKSDRIMIQVVMNMKTWVGFGISQGTGMSMNSHSKGSEVYACTDGSVRKYWVTGYSLDAGTSVAGSATCKQTTGRTEMTFTRPLKTNDTTTGLDITPTKYQPIIYAHGTANQLTVGYHENNKGGQEVKLANPNAPAIKPTKRNAEVALWAHIIFMILSWGFLLPLGVVVANRMRDVADVAKDSWFHVHRAVQYIGWTLQVFGFVAAVIYCQLYSAHFTVNHTKMGLAVVILGTLQPLNAFLRPHAPIDPSETKSCNRLVWEIAHKGSGYLAIFGGIANIWLGILLVKSKGYTLIVSNVASFLFFTGVGFVVIIFLFGVIFPNNSIFKCCLRCLMCSNFYSNSGDERKSLVKHESPDKQNGGPRSYSGTIPTTNENFKNVL